MGKFKKLIGITMAAMIASGSFAAVPMSAYADSMPIVTIGADLDEKQRETVYSFFGVDPTSAQVIEIHNQMERQYLEGKLPDAVIGTRTISCSYTMPTLSGGIVVKTANLNWVSDGMLANALLTSGIENCQVLATAPFEVSGTGALTGVLVAYEKSSGEQLDEEKKQLATEELIVTGEIIDEVLSDGQVMEEVTNPDGTTSYQQITETQILALLNDIKLAIINGEMSEDKVKEIVDARLAEYKIQLTEETYNRLISYLTSLSQVDYGEKIKESLGNLTDRIEKGFDIKFDVDIDIDFKTDKGSLKQFWENVLNFLRYLFGLEADVVDDTKTEATPGGIFENVDTSIIQYDEPVDGLDENTEIDRTPLENSSETEKSEDKTEEATDGFQIGTPDESVGTTNEEPGKTPDETPEETPEETVGSLDDVISGSGITGNETNTPQQAGSLDDLLS